jgi:hypothetical protein
MTVMKALQGSLLENQTLDEISEKFDELASADLPA